MSQIDNSYICNQTTGEKTYLAKEKYKDFNSSQKQKYLYEYKNNYYYQSPFLYNRNKSDLCKNYVKNKEIKENNKHFYSRINISDISLKKKRMNKNKNLKEFIYNKEIHPYNNSLKKSKYQRSNSMAYIKKRPYDLIKTQKSRDNSMITHNTKRNAFRLKSQCLSYNKLRKYNVFENNDEIENYNNSSRKNGILKSYPYTIKNYKQKTGVSKFSVEQTKLLNINIFCEKIFNVIKRHLFLNKIIFFKNIRSFEKIKMYEVSSDEYEFLEELKALGVTSKRELNILLKDIYTNIKRNEGINNGKNKK